MDENIFDEAGDEKDFGIEQRATDRHMQDIYSSGYRDAYQASMEDEKLLQVGFDHSYGLFVKLGLHLGQIRSMCNYAKERDSGVLALVQHRLEIIEKKCAYEKLIKWRGENEIDLSDLISKLTSIESRLVEFKAKLIEHSASRINEFVDLLILEEDLVNLVRDEVESASNNNNTTSQLNKMIKSLEF